MTKNTGALFGLIMVFCYNFLDAGKEVYSGYLVQSAHPMQVTFIIFSTVLIFFQIYCYLRIKQSYAAPLGNLKVVFLLNITTAGSWITFFYCLKYLEPAVAAAIITGVAPVLMVFISPLFFSTDRRQYRLLLLLGIAASSLWLSFISLREGDLVYNLTAEEVITGILLCVACAFFSIFSNVFSKRLSEEACPPEAIMAHRFYLTVLLTCAWSMQLPGGEHLEVQMFPGVLILALLGVIIPLWCLQYGIKALPPSQIMVLISVSPVFTFAFQLFDPRLSPSASSFVAIMLICFFSLAAEVWRIQYKERVIENGYHGLPEDRGR
jgi:drug/metabolite transporter (DMT)-like permease